MKTLALSLALLAVAIAGPARGGELQMATLEMNNADASEQNKTSIARKIAGRTVASHAGAEDLYGRADRLEANMAEKKQLRDLNKHEEAQESQFQIQTMTSDLQNAENVRNGR